MGIQKISEHIHVNLEYQIANVACIDTGEGLVLVDTPTMPEDVSHWKDFIDGMKETGIAYIIATHHHFDHILGNKRLGGNVIMQENAFEQMRKPGSTLLELLAPNLPEITQEKLDYLASEPLLTPKITFSDRMCLRLGDLTLQLFHVGGHSKGSLCVYVEEDKVLLTSDNLSPGQHPYRGQADHLEWIKALRWMKELDVDAIVPGHGPLCGKDEIDRFIEYLSRVWCIAESMIKKGAGRDEVIVETRNRMFDFFYVEPEALDEMTKLFDSGMPRLYDEILSRI
jgi:cyclase